MKTKRLVLSALFAALTFVATMVIQIKLTANGYVNIGDCMVVVSGVFLGPVYGALSAGIGSMLADIISGYFVYVPATFIIKAIMALVAFVVFKILSKRNNIFAIAVASFVSELIMIFGYYFYEIILYGAKAAFVGMPGNLLQGGFGFLCSIVLYLAISKNKYIKNQITYWQKSKKMS